MEKGVQSKKFLGPGKSRCIPFWSEFLSNNSEGNTNTTPLITFHNVYFCKTKYFEYSHPPTHRGLIPGPPWIPKSVDVQVSYVTWCSFCIKPRHMLLYIHFQSPLGYLQYLIQGKFYVNCCKDDANPM